MVAIMTEQGRDRLYVTNFRIKYTMEQLTLIREKVWGLKVLSHFCQTMKQWA